MNWDRRITLFASALALLVFGGFVSPPPADVAKAKPNPDDVDRILSTARQGSQVMDHLDDLSNRIGPRLTGSNSLRDARESARDRFQGFGIGNVRLEPWVEFPVGFNRGPWSGRTVEPTSKAMIRDGKTVEAKGDFAAPTAP